MKKRDFSVSRISNNIDSDAVDIITDSDLVEQDILRLKLPPFRSPNKDWEQSICSKWNLLVSNYINYEIDPQLDQQDLRDCEPRFVENIVGDGNCYFRALSFILTRSQEYHFNLRTIIVNNMLGKLKNSCDTFLRTKYVYQQRNYRSVKDWVTKTGMDKNNGFGSICDSVTF